MLAVAVSSSAGSHAATTGASRRRGTRRQQLATVAQATSGTAAPVSGVADKDKPDWAGEDSTLSRVVNAAINFKPLFALMKVGARSTMKSTAEKSGVPWGGIVTELEKSEVYQIKEEIEDKGMDYPAYYTVPFHGYDTGNLSWLAAFEVEPVSDVMALRVWKTETLTPLQAQTRLRKAIYNSIHAYAAQHQLAEAKEVLDIGCSVGLSSRWLAADFPKAQVTGLDMSPYFLAVAELRERQLAGGAGQRQRIKYVHGDMLDTKLPDASFDLVAIQFVVHECPAWVIDSLVVECKRLLRPGGIIALADNNPRSKVIQNLPPVLFTLMKSTEPHSDSYYAHNIEESMRQQGFQAVHTLESDPRHRVILAHV